VIIDEMADLMMTVQGEVETPIAMLAQKARAIGSTSSSRRNDPR